MGCTLRAFDVREAFLNERSISDGDELMFPRTGLRL
jgi:hypothetical protein